MNKYFRQASDLLDDSKKYFYVPGDLNDGIKNVVVSKEMSVEEINNYLNTIVSGKEYDSDCELGTLCAAGSCIVSFDELKSMIDEGGYNIISAECLNREMISIEYQQFNKEFSKKF